MSGALHDWLQRVWYASHPAGVLLLPFSWLFGAVVRLRRWLYRVGLLSAIDVGCPVVVVGNTAHAGGGEYVVALFHLVFDALERQHGVVRGGHDFFVDIWRDREIVLANFRIQRQLDFLRVDDHKLHVARVQAVHQAGQNGINPDTLAGTR